MERLRATVERGLRRRDEPEAPDPSAGEAPAREPIGGMLAAGAAALLVLAAAAVPVARPDLKQAAVAFSREAVRLEAQAEALAEAGVIAAGRLAGVREEVRVAASTPNDRAGAEAQRVELRRIDDDLRDRALAAAEAAAARLRIAETAAALAGALNPGVRACPAAPRRDAGRPDGPAPRAHRGRACRPRRLARRGHRHPARDDRGRPRRPHRPGERRAAVAAAAGPRRPPTGRRGQRSRRPPPSSAKPRRCSATAATGSASCSSGLTKPASPFPPPAARPRAWAASKPPRSPSAPRSGRADAAAVEAAAARLR